MKQYLPPKPMLRSALRQLPEERLEEIVNYLQDHTYPQTVEWLKSAGVTTSETSLLRLRRWFHSEQGNLANRKLVDQAVAEKKKENPNMTDEELFAYGQRRFAELALDQEDSLTWSRTQRINNDRQRTHIAEGQLEEKKKHNVTLQGELNLAVKKFRWEEAEHVLKLLKDQRAKEIAGMDVDHTEQLQMIGKLLYGEDF
jgi:hypothetical protein